MEDKRDACQSQLRRRSRSIQKHIRVKKQITPEDIKRKETFLGSIDFRKSCYGVPRNKYGRDSDKIK